MSSLQLKKTQKMEFPSLEVELGTSFKLLEVMGLQYFSLKDLNARTSHKRPSVLRLAYMLVLILLLCSMWLASTEKHFNEKKNVTARNFFMFAAEKILEFGLTSVMCVGIIQSFLMTSTNKLLLSKIEESINLVHREMGEKINLRGFSRLFWFRMYFVFLITAVLHGTVTFIGRNKEGYLLGQLIAIFPICALMSSIYKIILVVDLINFHLEMLKHLLDRVFENYPLKIIDNLNLHSSPIGHAEYLKTLNFLRKFYNLIKECASLQNSCCGITVLVHLCTLVISCLLGGYNTYLAFVGMNNDSDIPGKLIVSN